MYKKFIAAGCAIALTVSLSITAFAGMGHHYERSANSESFYSVCTGYLDVDGNGICDNCGTKKDCPGGIGTCNGTATCDTTARGLQNGSHNGNGCNRQNTQRNGHGSCNR